MQHEITEAGKLLDKQGHLAQRGYSKSLLLEYARQDIKANALKIKEWDYYLIYNEDFGVALTIADNSYMGLVSASFLDFANQREKTTSLMSILPMGKTNLPPSSKSGNTAVTNKNVRISFENDGKLRRLQLDMPKFHEEKQLKIDLELFDEPQDSMVIATPFQEAPTAFYYNQKIVGMRARGTVQYGKTHYEFDPKDSFGILDWGRGVWTYDNTWYWGAGNGMVDGKVFGFNIGYGFGDVSAASGNMLFYDGRAHKLEEVTFHIPKDETGNDDYLKPWTFTSSDGRFEMEFIPILDRKALTSAVVIMSDQHQVFGYFTGKAVLDDGTVLELKDFLGFAEKVRNKW